MRNLSDFPSPAAIAQARQPHSEPWQRLLWQAFGARGLVVLAWWLGSLFAEQIRARQGSFPFLAVTGATASGKSTLLEFLWKLLGQGNYEGVDPALASRASLLRLLEDSVNRPVVLLALRTDRVALDIEDLKYAADGRAVRLAMSTEGASAELRLRGGLVISQNDPVRGSPALMDRVCQVRLARAAHTPASREAALALESLPLPQLLGWVRAADRREQVVLGVMGALMEEYESNYLRHGLREGVARSHAQLAALVDALRVVMPLPDEQHMAATCYVHWMAIDRLEYLRPADPFAA